MSLICTGNRIQLTDSVDGRIAFDTNRQMFHTLNFVSGTRNIPARSNLDTNQSLDTSTAIHNVNAACTHLFGWAQPVFAGAQNAGMRDQAWHAMGGTCMMFISPGDRFNTEYRFANTTATTLVHIYGFLFRVAGGQIFFDEQVYFMRINSADAGVGDVIGFQAFDLNYKLWAGKFT